MDNFFKGGENVHKTDDVTLTDQVEHLKYNSAAFEIDTKQLSFREFLGRGEFGVVYKAELRLDNLKAIAVAVKCIRDSVKVDHYKALSAEIKLLAVIGHHVNIVNLIGAVTRRLQEGVLYMVLEYCSGGNLRRFLLNHRDRFSNTLDTDYFSMRAVQYQTPATVGDYVVPSSEMAPLTPLMVGRDTVVEYTNTVVKNEAYSKREPSTPGYGDVHLPLLGSHENSDYIQPTSRFHFDDDAAQRKRLTTLDLTIFAYQVANGMKFLHDRNCLHRDLAARNVLVCAGNILKISDFGMAKDLERYGGEYTKKTDAKVPFKWLAPECFTLKVFNRETDVWAYGVLLWEIFTVGKTPYAGVTLDNNFVRQLEEEYRLPQPNFADDAVWALLLSCWHSDPKQRPNFSLLTREFQHKLPAFVIAYYESLNVAPIANFVEQEEESGNPETTSPQLAPPPKNKSKSNRR